MDYTSAGCDAEWARNLSLAALDIQRNEGDVLSRALAQIASAASTGVRTCTVMVPRKQELHVKQELQRRNFEVQQWYYGLAVYW